MAYAEQLKDRQLKDYINEKSDADKTLIPTDIKSANGVFQGDINKFLIDFYLQEEKNIDYTISEKNKLAGIAEGAEVNVQPDWNQSDNSADDYIKNKPIIPVITGKADKVSGATSGNLAGLDANGNLTDSNVATNQVVVSTSVRTIVTLTQAQYDALATKDVNTEYNIIESV